MSQKRDNLDGDLKAARTRLLRFAEMAAANAAEVGSESLNTLSITIAAHLIAKLGEPAVKLYKQIGADLDSEHAKDWTIARRNEKWGNA